MPLTTDDDPVTYEEIMGLKSSSNLSNGDASINAIHALSNRLSTFRKWISDEAKVKVHSAVCIVNGEATDGTRNAPVMVVQKPNNGNIFKTGSNSAVLGGGVERSSAVIDNTALNGRIGTVDGEGDIALYDRTMGCCIRAVREIRSNEIFMTMPRSAMITPDLVAASDAGRAILACCKLNKNFNENNNAMGTNDIEDGDNSINLGFWDAFENTTICESRFSTKLARMTGMQVLVKILQERRRAETAQKKNYKKPTDLGESSKSANVASASLDEDEKNYTLAEHGTISSRAPFLAFLIHQRFSNSSRPLVVSNDMLYEDDIEDDETNENEFQFARDSDDGNALSAIDTHGGKMISMPLGAPETFAPYMRTLPSSVSLPLCWKRSELALLANCIPGVPLLQEVATSTSQLVAEFLAILDAGVSLRFPKTFPLGLLTWDRWVWAAAVFSSRNLPSECYINAGDEKAINFKPANKLEFQSPGHIWDELGVLIPLLDMLNHEIDEHQITWQSVGTLRDESNSEKIEQIPEKPGKERIEVPRAIVHKKIKKGCEMYCCYGNLSTSNLILQYGFAQINGKFDEVRMGWALPDAVGNVSPPNDYRPSFQVDKVDVFESNDEISINTWWSEERLKLLEQEIFAKADTSIMTSLRAFRKMTVTAYSDGTFHPILLATTVIATMPERYVSELMQKDKEERKVFVSKRHLRIIHRYLLFTFTRKLEKLLQNLDNGLKDHFGTLNLWTKASEGGIRYVKEQDSPGNVVGWQTFFDSQAYKAVMEVEKNYYAMGSDSCVLTLYDGQLRALQCSIDNVSDQETISEGVVKQLQDLGFEMNLDNNETEDGYENDVDSKFATGNMNSSMDSKVDTTPDESTEKADIIGKSNDPSDEKNADNGKSSSGSKSPRNRRRNRKKLDQRPPSIKLHIGNLSYTTTPAMLFDYFALIYGKDNVLECHIPKERETSKSRGFGFVDMPEAVANRALQSRQKHEVDGRVLKIAKSNSLGAVASSKPSEPVPHDASGRCATCGYSPKYCTCPKPNIPGYDRYFGNPVPMDRHPSFGPPYDMLNYNREPPRDYTYYNGPERYHDNRMNEYYGGNDRYRDYDRDRVPYDYRYDDEHYRGYERDDDRYQTGRRRERSRDRSRDKSIDSGSSNRQRMNQEARLSREKDEVRTSRRSRKGEIVDSDRNRKRSPERKEKNKKKKSKRRARSRSNSPP